MEEINDEQLSNVEVSINIVYGDSTIIYGGQKRILTVSVHLRRKSSSNKDVCVRITDEGDPLFLYSTIVTENDYQMLKQNQGLLVDFTSFPHKLVDLIKMCIDEQNKDNPRFVLLLRCNNETDLKTNGMVSLEVTEANPFRHLCHLSLKLSSSSNDMKLNHLSTCIKKLKNLNLHIEEEKKKSEFQLNEELKRISNELSKKMNENDKLKKDIHDKTIESSDRHARLVAQEKEKFLMLQSDADRRLEREKRDLSARMSEKISNLQSHISTLTKQNEDLEHKKNRLEANFREYQNRNSSNEGEINRLNQEISRIKMINSQINEQLTSSQSSVNLLKNNLSKLEEQLEEKTNALAHNNKTLDHLQQQKITTDRINEELNEKINKRERSVKLIFTDFQKSLDVIKKFKLTIKEQQIQINKDQDTIEYLEKQLELTKSELTNTKTECNESSQKIQKLTKEKDDLLVQLKEANEKVEEQERTIKNNQSMIAWLNKQLNEAEATGIGTKKTPLANAYLGMSLPTSSSKPNAASTPIVSGNNPLFSSSFKSNPRTPLSTMTSLGQIPSIPEEDTLIEANKENNLGLDPKYLMEEPRPPETSKSKYGGLIRASPESVMKPANQDKTGARPKTKGSTVRNHLKSDGIIRKIHTGT